MSSLKNIQLGERHRSSKFAVRQVEGGDSFATYIARTRDALSQAHAGKVRAEQIVNGNAPFELCPVGGYERGCEKPYRRGILLTHGLSDSPYHMRYLGAFFQSQGFRVMAVLLPGHGTQPGDLLDVRWQSWAATVAYGADCLSEEVDELYLAGFSAGGALSVYHAEHDARVRGVFLFSPALAITARAKWANVHRIYSWFAPRAAWVGVMPDEDDYKYESFCKNAAAQMFALTQHLPSSVKVPVFAAASADDATVKSVATLAFMQASTHEANQLVWYATEELAMPKVTWVNSAIPERMILSGAHTAVVIPPHDPHYGEMGAYVSCLHYHTRDAENASRCRNRHESVWQGEVTSKNLRQGLLCRLTFNPHFADLEKSMQKFIEGLP
ncbi:MAG: alpha/beta fold hydrolase [Sideroxydans sp.]|nr:alpha/beta fold hydrolase [Sideroxydans sp.]